jgi:Fic family protein
MTITSDHLALLRRVIASPNLGNEGVSITEIEAAFAKLQLDVSRRTLQRRLDTLLNSGEIEAFGGSRSVRYRLKSAVNRGLPTFATRPVVHHMVQQEPAKYDVTSAQKAAAQAIDGAPNPTPLSVAGLEVRDYVRGPITARKPVGYNRAFLDSYRPNRDYYLSATQRENLNHLGRTASDTQPAGTYARDIFDRLLVDLSWASSRLEGNTYSRLDTQRLVEFGQAADGKDVKETLMVLNHKAAIEMLIENAADISFNRFTLLNLHAALSDNLVPDQLDVGRLRTRSVGITGTVFIPLDMPQQLNECFDLILQKAEQIADPFEQAFFSMVHLPYLQPFIDVNKRVSRLAANIPLIRENLCPLSFVDVPNQSYLDGILGVYELNRVELLRDVFMWAYERSCQRYMAIKQSIGDPDAFRMKYREAIQHVVRTVVQTQLRGTAEEIIAVAANRVAAADAEPFVEAVTVDLNYLYEGNVVRYRLRKSEWEAWGFKRG